MAKNSSRQVEHYEGLPELALTDVTCPVCLSVMIKPVTMPCNHSLCLNCFELNVTESNLACPMCRRRISVWVRRTRKNKCLVNETLWKNIQDNFKDKLQENLNGNDELENYFLSTLPERRESMPGEIKEEFDAQLKKLQIEEEKRRKEEEAASEKIIKELKKEIDVEETALSQSKRLCQQDFEFARQLRLSQMKEKLSKLKLKKEKKLPLSDSSPRGLPRENSNRPLDHYLDLWSSPPSANDDSPTRKNNSFEGFKDYKYETPKSECKDSKSLSKNNLVDDLEVCKKKSPSRSVTPSSTPKQSHSQSSSKQSNTSRPLKDITSSYSSESENEFDSEENIKAGVNSSIKSRSKTEENVITRVSPQILSKSEANLRAKNSCSPKPFTRIETEDENRNFNVQNGDLFLQTQLEPSEISENSSKTKGENLPNEEEKANVLKAFNNLEHVDEASLNLFIKEQKALEERLKQEKEDRIFARQLQRDLRKVDRTKGSEDEYCLRTRFETTETPGSSPFKMPSFNVKSPASESSLSPRCSKSFTTPTNKAKKHVFTPCASPSNKISTPSNNQISPRTCASTSKVTYYTPPIDSSPHTSASTSKSTFSITPTNSAKKHKIRQTTLMESLGKRRRL